MEKLIRNRDIAAQKEKERRDVWFMFEKLTQYTFQTPKETKVFNYCAQCLVEYLEFCQQIPSFRGVALENIPEKDIKKGVSDDY